MTRTHLTVLAALLALAPSAARAAPELDFLDADLAAAPVALDLVGDGDLVLATRSSLVRLDSLGAEARSHTLDAAVDDLAIDRRTGTIYVVGAARLAAHGPDLAPLWRLPLPAGPAQLAVGEHGTVAALAAGQLHIVDEHGRPRVTADLALSDARDLAVLDAAGLVAVTGAVSTTCDEPIDSLALVAHSLDGAPLWQSTNSSECDTPTRGVALARGGDGYLYVLAEVEGRLPAFLRERPHVVFDGYTDPETANPAQAAYFARFAADGAHLLGQFFALPDEGAVVRPAAIAADEHGNVFLTGTATHSLGAADERSVTAALDAPAGFYQVVAPDFEARHVWRPIEADGMTSELGALALAGDRVVALLTAAPLPGQSEGALPPGPSILVWPDDHGPLEAEKRPDPETQGTFGYESGVSGSDPTCYCDAAAFPTPAALVSLGALMLVSLPRPRRRPRA